MAVKFTYRKNDVELSRLTAETTPVAADILLLQKGTGSGDLRRKLLFSDLLANVATGIVNSILPTGILVPWVTLTAPTGWVHASGRTIGSPTSGATERANSDTANLFALLWASFSNTELPIQDSAGSPSTRGASASNDYAANKRLPLPDTRGRAIFGLDGIGPVAGRVTTAGSGIDGETIGAAGGAQTVTLEAGNVPAHTHDTAGVPSLTTLEVHSGSGSTVSAPDSPSTETLTSTSVGDGDPVNKMPPALILPWIIKL
jgi:microcystin-dependent protein